MAAVHRAAATVVSLILALAEVGAAASPPSRSTVVVELDRGGFHWLDAGVGAAAALALVALAYGVLLLRRGVTPPEPERGPHD
jgi:hypothetical protein